MVFAEDFSHCVVTGSISHHCFDGEFFRDGSICLRKKRGRFIRIKSQVSKNIAADWGHVGNDGFGYLSVRFSLECRCFFRCKTKISKDVAVGWGDVT